MIKVGVAGVTGYVGVELIRLLMGHPEVEIVLAAAGSHAGKQIAEVYPHLRGILEMQASSPDPAEMAALCDVVFTALPSGIVGEFAEVILKSGKKLIDLGADFRLAAQTDALAQSAYGLPEIVSREAIKKSQLIANPGCYPTCIALGVFPALASKIVNTEGMIFDAKSGVSGAGRSPTTQSHFCEAAENFKAYAIAGSHRHTPEIEQMLGWIVGSDVIVQFTPHLVPMVRGLLATSYLKLQKAVSMEEIWEIYSERYKNEPFVRLYPLGELPQTANVRGSNYCDIGLALDPRTKTLIVVSVIDNLVKGAAGQAVQNMNLLFELPETLGLEKLCPVHP